MPTSARTAEPDSPLLAGHGGGLDRARAAFPKAPEPWLDLSTGINPFPYSWAGLEDGDWTRLPDEAALDRLMAAAAAAFAAPSSQVMVAASGSQALIQTLPYLRPTGARVRLQAPTYSEHALCWSRAGHEVGPSALPLQDLEGHNAPDVVILGQPNNPDGHLWPLADLRTAADVLARRGGWLVVDEAFCDGLPEASLAPHCGADGLIVLRSFGKFYGLAGLRLGFALGPEAVIAPLRDRLGPWAVSGTACRIGALAYEDRDWQAAMRVKLGRTCCRLDAILSAAGLSPIGGTDLFRTVECDQAAKVFTACARAGILLRAFADAPRRLRFGLPADDIQENRLAQALSNGR